MSIDPEVISPCSSAGKNAIRLIPKRLFWHYWPSIYRGCGNPENSSPTAFDGLASRLHLETSYELLNKIKES